MLSPNLLYSQLKNGRKCLKIEKSNMAATAELKCIDVHIFRTKQGRNSNEMCFCMFSYMGNPMPYSVLS